MTLPVRFSARPGTPLGLMLLVTGVFAALVVSYVGFDRLPMTICVFKSATGWPCVTCGGTRAAVHLAHLDWKGALVLNPLVTLLGAALVPWAAADLALVPRRRAVSMDVAPTAKAWLGWAAILLATANWAWLIHAGR